MSGDWLPGLRVGHAEDADGCTGCTVLLGPFRGVAVPFGPATATRELRTMRHDHLVDAADAVLLTGGSAFGLAAADGVVRWLAERGAGYDTGLARVPIVPAAAIYDLGTGDARHWPDAALGRAACEAATTERPASGRTGAGAGATVGKLLGRDAAARGGTGTARAALGEYTVVALVVVNAYGDIIGSDGAVLAGPRIAGGRFLDSAAALRDPGTAARFPGTTPAASTTLAVVATDAPVGRHRLGAIAAMAAAGMARRIRPVFSPFDGDLIFSLSTAAGTPSVSPPLLVSLGSVAADLVADAVLDAVASRS
jgi:L-aminopeptidase/D-esterase-like protein